MMAKLHPNQLYYGDNLDVLRRYIKDETVDLIYLDPPFKSDQDYNVLFAEHSCERAAAQIKAFEDTWRWDMAAEEAYADVLRHGGKIADMIGGLRGFLGESDMMAYLAMMAPRLIELRRVLKPTGSIYLHCDPTASHYLKIIMDAIFGPTHFRNEIIWKRKAGRGETNRVAVRFGVSTDSILLYVKDCGKFSRQYRESNPDYIRTKFTHTDDSGRRYRLDNITSPSYRKNLVYEYKGYKPPEKGWAVSRERMEQMESEGRLYLPEDKSKRIQRKRFLDELEGETVDSLWDDISPINSQAQERLGYPTQKPEALLERIINASSNVGDVVLDPFCGCGTAVAVAQRLKRRWIGIDITHLAIGLIKRRLKDAFGGRVKYEVIGEPTSLPDAATLAKEDPYQFQWWALGLVGARPVEQRKGADRGIDGKIYFQDEPTGKPKTVVFSVKSGTVNVSHIRDLRGVLDREEAAIGVYISLNAPTGPMIMEAASAGFYRSPAFSKQYPKLQILTIEQLLDNRQIDMPSGDVAFNLTFKRAKANKEEDGDHPGFL